MEKMDMMLWNGYLSSHRVTNGMISPSPNALKYEKARNRVSMAGNSYLS